MKKALSAQQRATLIKVLRERFEVHKERHQGIAWAKVLERLESNSGKLWSLSEMERTGGEPDVVGKDTKSGEFIFHDCSPQTPVNRVSLCYDATALASRKEHKPRGSAMEMAAGMGVEVLTEEEYIALQKLGEFDTKRSSWLRTPDAMRQLGGALYGERRYNRVFIGCNGAESYYGGRGFRGALRI